MSSLFASKGVLETAGDRERQRIDRPRFRPVALVAWWSRQAGHGVERGNRGGIGFWTAEQCAAVAWASEDGVPAARTARSAEPTALLGLSDASGQVAMRAKVESFGSDALTLRWTARPSEPWLVHYLALGGASLRSARVGWASSAPAAERTDLLLVATAEGSTIGIGAAAGRHQAAAGYSAPDGATPGEVIGAQRTNVSIVDLDPHPGLACYLALEGVRTRVGVEVSPTRPGSRRTRVGFRPDALLLFSWGLAGSPDPRGIGRLCLGGTSGDEHGCLSWDDRNVSAPATATHVLSSAEHALVVTDTRTGGVHARAKLASLDDRGFTLDWTESDGVDRQFAYVALTGRDDRGPARRIVRGLRRPHV